MRVSVLAGQALQQLVDELHRLHHSRVPIPRATLTRSGVRHRVRKRRVVPDRAARAPDLAEAEGEGVGGVPGRLLQQRQALGRRVELAPRVLDHLGVGRSTEPSLQLSREPEQSRVVRRVGEAFLDSLDRTRLALVDPVRSNGRPSESRQQSQPKPAVAALTVGVGRCDLRHKRVLRFAEREIVAIESFR